MAEPEMFDNVLEVLKSHYQDIGFKDAMSQVEALQATSKALKFSIAVIGESGAGKTTLVNALRGHEDVYNESQLSSLLIEEPENFEPVGHVHPTFPNTVIWDLPGYVPSEQPSLYLKGINFENYNILLLCFADLLTEGHLQLLKAAKQKGKMFYVICTQVDLTVHTCKRRQKTQYTLQDTLQDIRKGIIELLQKGGLNCDRVFLVSGLELQKYDFSELEDALERDILNMNRTIDGAKEDFKCWRKEELQEFYVACDAGGLADLPVLIQSALNTPVNIRLDIAVTGEVGSGKSAFVNALRDLALNEGEKAETGVVDTTRKPTAFPHPEVPNVYIWDLPGFGTSELPIDLYLKYVDLNRYNFFIIVASERFKHAHSCLVKAISALGKKFFFVRSKIDSDIEASLKQQGSVATLDAVELLEKVKKGNLDALKKQDVSQPEVFLVSSLDSHKYEMPQLREALGKEISGLKKQALLRSIPNIIFQMVRWKRKKLVKDACGKALQICLYAIEKPGPEAIDHLVSTLANYCEDFGLNNNSLEQMAEATGKGAEDLKCEIRCPLVRAIVPSDILKLVSAPVPIALRVWNYVPYWGQSSPAEVSLVLTYNLLKSTIWDMSEDAERVLRKAYDVI